MQHRELIKLAITHQPVPYTPWSIGFTQEAREKLIAHYGSAAALTQELDNHFVEFDCRLPAQVDLGDGRLRDAYGVIWNRSVDRDIGVVEGQVLPEPTLAGYTFPLLDDPSRYTHIGAGIAAAPDRFRRFNIGFSLFERAWTLRGMEALMMDFIENPQFVDALLDAITESNLTQIRHALQYDIDCVYFGDDWGSQRGLLMGPKLWKRFIKPRLERMYGAVHAAGKFVSIHSCGKVDSLFGELVDIGVNLFNPFQPEVMDVVALKHAYHGRLAFHGGLSTQKILPYGSVAEVVAETKKLLALGAIGGYIFSPAHAVEGDVPVENMVAFIDTMKAQAGYRQTVRA